MKIVIPFVLFCCFVLSSCSDSSKHIEYYPDKKVKFEVPLADGKWNGKAVSYYDDGTIAGEFIYLNGKKHGLCQEFYRSGKLETKSFYHHDVLIDTSDFFLETGELVMRTIQDKHGLPVDQIKYKKSGERDYAHLHPMVFLTTDTLRTAKLKAGVPTSMFVRVANVDPERYKEGTLIIGSKFKGLIAQDTIFMLDAKPSKGFEYPFTPTKLGSNLINGLLVLHSEEAGQTPKLFNLECKFEVVD